MSALRLEVDITALKIEDKADIRAGADGASARGRQQRTSILIFAMKEASVGHSENSLA